MIDSIGQALDIVGGLTSPSKLSCYSFNIPAVKCQVGSKLRKVEGTVCFNCYALKGFYRKYRATVDPSQRRRFDALSHPQWVESMTYLVTTRKMSIFRWFDSGDLQSVHHLQNIAGVAMNCPRCKFWLPTREYSIVSDYVRKHGQVPSNLILRLSAHLVDGSPPSALAKRLGVRTSTVVTHGATCPASQQKNKCLQCRRCWSKVGNISYQNH